MKFFTPEMNDGNHVFVFGSNGAGRHGAGAAYTAWKHWGAITGIGVGMAGQSYAIPTKDKRLKTLSLDEIKCHVLNFVKFASVNPSTTFLVTRIGCGLAGYRDDQISPMFNNAPSNCVLPEEWKR